MDKRKLKQYFIFLMVALLLATLEPAAAIETATAGKVTEKLIVGAPIKPDYSLAVTSTELLNKPKHNKGVTLVDIRSPEEFERLRIPGSINVALYALKAKAYLKAQPFVLVSTGYEWRDLESECKSCSRAASSRRFFSAGWWHGKVKAGRLRGIDCWRRHTEKSLHTFFFTKRITKDIKVFDVSPKPLPDAKKLIPGNVHVKNIESLLKLAQAKQSHISHPRVVQRER